LGAREVKCLVLSKPQSPPKFRDKPAVLSGEDVKVMLSGNSFFIKNSSLKQTRSTPQRNIMLELMRQALHTSLLLQQLQVGMSE